MKTSRTDSLPCVGLLDFFCFFWVQYLELTSPNRNVTQMTFMSLDVQDWLTSLGPNWKKWNRGITQTTISPEAKFIHCAGKNRQLAASEVLSSWTTQKHRDALAPLPWPPERSYWLALRSISSRMTGIENNRPRVLSCWIQTNRARQRNTTTWHSYGPLSPRCWVSIETALGPSVIALY